MSTTMRAAWYEKTGPASQVLKIGELPVPHPKSGEVLVRVRASGINPADIKRRAGWGGASMDHTLVVPHTDGAGDIVEVGDGVSRQRVGERVWLWNAQGGYGDTGRSMGTAAEYVALPAEQAEPLPEKLSYAQGACLGVPAQTAFISVFRDGSVKDLTLLVAGGAGAVGHFAVQFAKSGGAYVLATISNDAKAKHARMAGADIVINYKKENVVECIMKATGGDGVDRIVEVDLGANMEFDVPVIKLRGVIASYSSTFNPEPVLPYYPLAFKGITLQLVQGFLLNQDEHKAAAELINTLSLSGKLQVPVKINYRLKDIVAAHEAVESGKTIGNTVICL